MSRVPSAGWEDRLARLRFRRAVTLMVMTLVLPGSAQLVAGRRRLGRLALRTWLAVVLLGAVVVLLGIVWPHSALWLLSNTAVLAGLRLGLLLLALGWAALFVDAWRLGEPLGLRQRQRLAMVGLNGVLCFSVAGALLFASHVVGVQRELLGTVFADGHASEATQGRYNVLLLGGDSGADRWGLRPDSITVASIDAETGRTVLFGLPRNMQSFPFPEGTVMHEQFPDGYDCADCYLNSLSTFAADNRELFRRHPHPGVEATIQGVEGITGLDISYFAMVNLRGFRELVDAVGGVRLTVRDRIPIGGVGAPITGYIEPGERRLDGFETLWFARSRSGADDYSRMARQKCVMSAMLEQLSPAVVMTKFSAIARAGQKVISTDLPASEVDTFVGLALKAKTQPLTTVSFVPPRVNTAEPDVAAIQERVQQAIARAEGSAEGTVQPARKRGRGAAGSAAGTAPATTGGSIGSLADGYAANDAADLSSAC